MPRQATSTNERKEAAAKPARNGSATHIPADFELVDAHQEDSDRGEDDDERVVRGRQVEVRDVDLVEVLAVLNILEPILTERLPLRVWLHDGESVRSRGDVRRDWFKRTRKTPSLAVKRGSLTRSIPLTSKTVVVFRMPGEWSDQP